MKMCIGKHNLLLKVLSKKSGKRDLRPASQHSCSLQIPTDFLLKVLSKKSGKRDLNPRPLSPEPSALPTALLPEKKTPTQRMDVTGATGLEPAIFGVTGRRDNQLRYAPNVCQIYQKN